MLRTTAPLDGWERDDAEPLPHFYVVPLECSEVVDAAATPAPPAQGCNWLYSCTKRSSMRAQYNFQGSPCMDCFVHMCYESCALCQEHKQLGKSWLQHVQRMGR